MIEQKSVRKVFISIFVIILTYILILQSHLYKSSSAIMIKDLTSKQVSSLDISFLGGNPSSQMQDSKVIETYLTSHEILTKLDKKFQLKEHYQSDEVDFIDRLSDSSTQEEFLELYLKRIEVIYDELSGVLHVGFLHTDKTLSQKILLEIITLAEAQLNIYNQINAKKYLAFASDSVEKNKISLDQSIKKLEAYQNQNLVLDPTANAETKNSIISNLEAELVSKTTKLQQIENYMSKDSFEVTNLKNEIKTLKNSLKKTKSELSGNDKERLNLVLFEFERIKNQVEFDKEKYKQSLIQYEIAKTDVDKDAKTLQVIVQANMPDGYSLPDKPLAILNTIIALGLLFGIVSLILAIIKDHKE